MPSTLNRLFSSATVASPSSRPSGSNSQDGPPPNYDPHQEGAIALPGGYTKLPNGIVLDASGKPCKQCTSGSAWMAMMRKASNKSPSSSTPTTTSTTPLSTDIPPSDCPPDVDTLGTHTWTLLHSMAATYPTSAPVSMQSTMRSFLSTFSQLYPCGTCASDLRDWMKVPGNEPRVSGQDELGTWMCEAHNAVNVKLGKEEFDCSLWKERWRDGWKDGRCD